MSRRDRAFVASMYDNYSLGSDVHRQLDIAPENHAVAKIGGWPTVIQSNLSKRGNRDFVFQITSDGKTGLNFCDSGVMYFLRHAKKGTWRSEWACH